MALLFCEGFDDGMAASKWMIGAGNTFPAGTGRYGASALFDNNNDILTKGLGSGPGVGTAIVGFACKINSISAPVVFLELSTDSAASLQLSLKFEMNGTLTVRRGGASSTTLLTSSATFVVGAWHYIELKATVSDTTGDVELRMDGKSVGTFSGDTKFMGTSNNIDTVRFGGTTSINASVDDVYVCDTTGSVNNDFLGDIKVETLYPNGNGNSSQLTGSDGNQTDNYLLVDEAGTPSTADYVVGASAGLKDTYTFTDLATATGPIKGVQLTSYANKTDAGARDLINVTRSSGTEADSASMALQTTYVAHSSIQETNPNGGGAWTVTDVNNAEFGAKVN